MSIAETIKSLRNGAGYSQAKLAEFIGVDRSAIAQWENGLSEPRMGNVRKLATLFGIPVSKLIDSKESSTGAFVRLTTLGKVHAGPFADEDASSRTIDIPATVLRRHPSAQAVLVEGDCMNRVAPDGAAVVFDPNLMPLNGQIAVVETEDHQALIRRWYKGSNTLMLVADSYQEFDDIVVSLDTPIRVIGTVVWMQSASEFES